MKDRSGVVIIENNKVALIQRVRNGSTYYVFPGGGVEEGETLEEAAKREAFEELGVEVKVHECLVKVPFNGTQYYFLADIISGTFGTGQGEEYANQNNGTYLPMWVEIEALPSLKVIPIEVVLKIQAMIN